MRYGLAAGLEFEQVGNERLLTFPGGNIAVINHSACIILDTVLESEEFHEGAAAIKLVETFGIDYEVALRDAQKALEDLRQKHIIEPVINEPNSWKKYERITRRSFIAGMAAAGLSFLSSESVLGKDSASVAKKVYADVVLPQESGLSNRQFGIASLESFVAEHGVVASVLPYGPFAQVLIESIDPNRVALKSQRGAHASMLVRADYSPSEVTQECTNTSWEFGKHPTTQADVILDIATRQEKLCWDLDREAKKSGIPVVHTVIAPGELPQAYRIFGKMFGLADRCNELADYLARILVTLSQVKERATTPKSIYFAQGFCGLNTRNKASLFDSIVSAVGASNVAHDLSEQECADIDFQQILEWSPDFVLLSLQKTADSENQERVVEEMWDAMREITHTTILRSPCLPVDWFGRTPLLSQTVGALWLCYQLYPEECDFDLGEVVREYFELFFGIDLSFHERANCARLQRQ